MEDSDWRLAQALRSSADASRHGAAGYLDQRRTNSHVRAASELPALLELHRLTLAPPRAGCRFEHPRRRSTTRSAASVRVESPTCQLVPIAADQQRAAAMAIRAAARRVVHV